jgi:transcriptional regulator with XRE-family HTH domain
MARDINFRMNWEQFRIDLLNYMQGEQLTQTALATKLGISLGTLTRYLNGDRVPASDILLYAMKLMGRVPADYVQDDVEQLTEERATVVMKAKK